jgi:hypothetical protein
MTSLLWKTILESISSVILSQKKPAEWKDVPPSIDDMIHVEKEANDVSPFDPLRLRNTMHMRFIQKKGVVMRCRELEGFAKVLVFFELEEGDPTPWDMWARIFTGFGRCGKGGIFEPWRIVWFASPQLRQLPPVGYPVEAVHLNGGYAYPCEPSTIVIYRREEGTRVLIHEMLHAACTDDMNMGIERREAETEGWAEIFLIAILANGSVARAKALWAIQAKWVATQNSILKSIYGVVGPKDYAWRYTIGREQLFQRLGLSIPSTKRGSIQASCSLRFTSPELEPAGH